jgi:hypothetical protein
MKNLILIFLVSVVPFFAFAESQVEVVTPQAMSFAAGGGDTVLSHNFGSVFVNSRVYVDLIITAKGDAPTELRRMDIAGMDFDAYTNCPDSLPVGQKCTVRITYWPHYKGMDNGRLYLTFSNSRTIINLFGRAI